MLVNLKQILDIAEEGKFAVPAFNVYNMEMTIGALQAAQEAKSPVIIQTYSRLFTNGEAYYLAPSVLAAAKKADVPVCFHLDHGAGFNEVIRALKYGATGIMIDKSELDLSENIAETKRAVDLCSAVNIPVEGEIGHIGSVSDSSFSEHTSVADAKKYAEETGVCALAVMVGTAHGRYKQAPKLNIKRIEEIHESIDAHLVLHGGSGVDDNQIKEAIDAGIRKINFGTDVCYSFLDKVFETSRSIVAVDLFMKDAIESVKQFALGKIELLGAKNRV